MVRWLTLFFILFISFSSYSQFHESVFPRESGSGLIGKLRLEFRPSSVLTYGEAREEMYTKIYNILDSVECVYSGYKLYLPSSSRNPIGDLFMGGSQYGINCEHTFPQSKGAGTGNARSDMHHLFPSRAGVNEARLNYPFAEIDDRTTNTWYYKREEEPSIPLMNIDLYSELGFRTFEPKEGHKGNVARAVFYFYTIYREVADADFFGIQRKTLCDWHYDDPVDSLEWVRNKQIAAWQSGKRNPFILDCSLAVRTYCPDIAERCQITSVSDRLGKIQNIYPSPARDKLHIEYMEITAPFIWKIIATDGELHLNGEGDVSSQLQVIELTKLNTGMYHIQLLDQGTGKIIGRGSFLKV